MAPVTIPEGWAFFEKAPGVAAGLLVAADSIKADRKNDVRTVTGGYVVTVEVAEAYHEALGLQEPESAGDGGAQTPEPQGDGGASEPEPLPVTAESSNAEIDGYAAGLEPPVDLSSAKNRVEKIALLEAARKPTTEPTTEE